MESTKKKFLAIFLQEWELYNKQGSAFAKKASQKQMAVSTAPFDVPVEAGEIRLFAAYKRPLRGLVYKQWEDDAWIIIPLSDFSVPATDREILVGKNVYQLWNTFIITREFLERSWVINTVSLEDRKDLSTALLHTMIGDSLVAGQEECMGAPIVSIADPRLEYESYFGFSNEYIDEVEEKRAKFEEDILIHIASVLHNRYEESNYRLAAATEKVQVDLLFVKKTQLPSFEDIWDRCEPQSLFVSIEPGEGVRKLRFSILDGKVVRDSAQKEGGLPIKVLRKETASEIGEGIFDPNKKEIVIEIDSGKLTSSLDDLSQIVLVAVI